MKVYLPSDVFAPGRFPSLTYNERASTKLRTEVESYLMTGGGSCLVVYGPSKTGKTVLIEKWLPEDSAIWIKGDQIGKIDDLYRHIIDQLDLYTEVSVEESTTDTLGVDVGVDVQLVPHVLRFKAGARGAASASASKTHLRTSLSSSVVKLALREKPVPIVIDDFHFLSAKLRASVARAVKDLIRYTHVVLIAIPNRAFEPVRTQRDMDGRVLHLEVMPWIDEELVKIAEDGFPLLRIRDEGGKIGKTLAEASHGAPFIMQALCLEYSIAIGRANAKPTEERTAKEPGDWDAFFRSVADRRRPGVFDALAKGKDTRGVERAARLLKDGRSTDIYGATLLALSKMGAAKRVTKQQVAAQMNTLVVDAPTASTVAGTLGHLSEIAHNMRGDDDPALDYNDPNLDILDPFLAFYLQRAAWDLPAPPGSRR